jgi:hypothetical protein
MLILGSSSASAQGSSARLGAPIAVTDPAWCPQGQGGERPDATPKCGSDGQAEDKAKKEEPAYNLLRYEEDYSCLKDPSRRSDFWDPIKYIPLCGREDWYVTLGGEVRERYEFYHDLNAGLAPANAQGNNQDFLERYLLYADVHLGPYFRFFVQTVTGLEDGRIGGPRPDIDRDPFGFHQAFADFILPLGAEKDRLTARLGRQELEYG